MITFSKQVHACSLFIVSHYDRDYFIVRRADIRNQGDVSVFPENSPVYAEIQMANSHAFFLIVWSETGSDLLVMLLSARLVKFCLDTTASKFETWKTFSFCRHWVTNTAPHGSTDK